MTNALVHGSLLEDDELALRITVWQTSVRVEVFDRNPDRPIRHDPSSSDGSGRGVALIEDLADACGLNPGESGKWVWFDLML